MRAAFIAWWIAAFGGIVEFTGYFGYGSGAIAHTLYVWAIIYAVCFNKI